MVGGVRQEGGQDVVVRLAAVIEGQHHLPDDSNDSFWFVDNSGLILEHHFHIDMHTGGLPVVGIERTGLTSLPICEHLTIEGAQACLSILHHSRVLNRFRLRCDANHCATSFGYFYCDVEGRPGYQFLCMRVRRRFGWL